MGTDDDLDWLAALAGRARAGTDPRTLREADLLRVAARTWTPRPLLAEPDPADAEALVAQARREGVFDRAWCAGCAERWRRWREGAWVGRGVGLAVAALLAVLVFGLLPPRSDDRPDAVLRGSRADGVWLLRSASPLAQRDRIAAELAATGLAVRRYERLGRFGLDADVPAGAAAAIAPTLQRLGVQPGTDGVLRIEIESAP